MEEVIDLPNKYMYKNHFPDTLHMFQIEQNDNYFLLLHAKRIGSQLVPSFVL